MKKEIKTETIVMAHNALKGAKLTKMEDGEKFSAIKAARVLKPAAESFTGLVEDAKEKLKPENWDELKEKAGRFNSLSGEEQAAVNAALTAYNRSVEECVKDELAKPCEVEISPLSEEAFGRLLSSNDFEMQTIMALQDALCE